MNKGVIFLGMGFELVGLCMGGYWLGEYVDAYMGWEKSSAYLILLLLVGWFVHFFILIRKFMEEDNDGKASDDTPRS